MGPKSKFSAGAHEHAAQIVREGIRNGRWLPGETLEVTALASELGVSASPVREAFARLRGERLLETRHRDGYSIPLLQPHELEGEYRFVSMVATSLSTFVTRLTVTRISLATSYSERVDRLLMALAKAADLPSAALMLHQSTLRLGPYIRAEPLVVKGAERDIAEMEQLIGGGYAKALGELIEHHFVNCVTAVPALGRYVFEHSKRFEKAFE